MAIQAVNNAQIIVETSDISGWIGTIGETPGQVTVQEFVPFGGGGFVQRYPGIKSGKWSLDGAADHDTTGVSSLLGVTLLGTQLGVSVAVPTTGTTVATGDWAQFGIGRLTSYQSMSAQIDQLAKFAVELETDGGFVVSGEVGAPLASRTTAGYTGAAVAQTGPVTGKSLYAILHVTAASGTNLAVKVQSDDNAGFTTPTDRITFSTVSAVGRQQSSVAGPLNTETHWRVTATIATGTFSFACYFGVA
jgi:hypothetical protein